MKLKITQQTPRLTELGIEKGKIYEVDEEQPIVTDAWKIKVPKLQKGKFRFALKERIRSSISIYESDYTHLKSHLVAF